MLVCALTDLLLAHRPVVAWLMRDLTALAQPEIGHRITAHAIHLERLLVGQVRVAAAVGALIGSPPATCRTSARYATRSPPRRSALVIRAGQRWTTPRLTLFTTILMACGDVAMECRMLKGIKRRAERL